MAQSRESATDIWGARTPYNRDGEWPARVDEHTVVEPDRWVSSACVLCSNGCGLDIGVKDGRIVGVRGRADDHVNRGRLGPKGLNGWEANNSSDRLTHPLIRRDGQLVSATWDEAMGLIVDKARQIRERYSASAIGFYTSGQLFLEEYYTLALIGKAGLGTPHMDGNTRLCSATAAIALKETFGADGQPGCYDDLDETDCILLVGHNVAETQTVLWMRVLDRRRGSNPPRLIVIDPRRTATAEEADLHLAPRLGTNVALLNGLIHLLIENGYADRKFIDRHTVGFPELAATVAHYTPDRVSQITGVPREHLLQAAAIIGKARSLVSTCLQGVYQSNQATAAAVQVNNLNLILGRIGRPGCGVLQMNGQPSAQNTRECGADGELPGFRNWDNMQHIEELARLWNVDPSVMPYWTPPTHALQIFRYCETGSIRMLWISATNPAASLPHLDRVRSILENPDLFVVAQDAFPTETTELADVVLPAAIWGEKTGTFTNSDRTVHLSHKAVDPPGEARADLDIFLDFARRMDFRDKDGAPLIKWTTPEGAFTAWKECSRGRPCDYSGMTYEQLTASSGIRWPCNEQYPSGRPRLYEDLSFPTDAAVCESYGHDLVTGAKHQLTDYLSRNPRGRAILKAAEYVPPPEGTDEHYPLLLTTGRLVHHFHTRTKTARAQALAQASPEPFIQVSEQDAEQLGIRDGDWLRLTSRRGAVEAPARIGGIAPGQVFMPFHFGYWDNPGYATCPNELTLYEWDPVSKQPLYKQTAVRLEVISEALSRQPEIVRRHPDQSAEAVTESDLIEHMAQSAEVLTKALRGFHTPRGHFADYLGLLYESEQRLARGFDHISQSHAAEPDVALISGRFAAWAEDSSRSLEVFIEQYGERHHGEPGRLDSALLKTRKPTSFALVRNLHDLWLMANESLVSLIILEQAARAKRDQMLLDTLRKIQDRNERQRAWLMTRLRQAAPQVLTVPA